MSTSARIGSEIAGFRIESVLGRGGMSVVYLAEQTRLGRKVALKLLGPELIARDESFRERFLQESQLAAHLDHPNILPIYDAGEEGGWLYIAMRYIDGRDIGQIVEQDGVLSVGRTFFILDQVASALDTAHEHGLVHRDVKPANILLVGDSDQVFLTDFGVAKPTTSAGLTRTGFFIGTPEYSAPEQIEGRAVDARTDVYALGGVLYSCLTANAPYARTTEVALLQAHLQDPPPKVSEARPDLSPTLDRVIATAMAKSPEDRYSTCGELVAAARAASLDRPHTAPARVATSEPPRVPPPAAAVPAAAAPPPAAPPPAAPPQEPAPVAHGGPASPGRRMWWLVGLLAAAVVGLGVALIAVLATGGSSSSTTTTGGTSFTVAMKSSAEVPKSSKPSSGTAKVTIDGTKVCWSFTLQGVDQPNAAHIHLGGPTVSGPVVVPLGAGFKSSGCTTTTAAISRQILANPAGYYVNVHSVSYPDGAVRGQLAGAPAGGGAVAVGLAGVVPRPVFKYCKVQTKPRAGAAETAECVPPTGTSASAYPSSVELSIFPDAASASAA